MKTTIKCVLALCIAALPGLAASQAAPWPSKPIKAVVPFPAGAATDILARLVLERVSKQLGQPIIVENKPGAGGTIGEAAVAQADPDGYTIMVHSNSHTLTPWTYKNLSYNAARDFVGVIPLASVPMAIVTSVDKRWSAPSDLVRAAKANPGSINYSSSGAGGATHLGAERFRLAGGFTATHIPYKGSAEALREVLAGRVDFHVAPLGLVVPHLRAGKLIALASTSSKRSSALPSVQTTVEAGLANSQYDVWIGMFAPAKTPRAIINRLNEEAAKAIRTPEVKERFASMVMDEMLMSVDEFGDFLKADFETNRLLVKATGIEPN